MDTWNGQAYFHSLVERSTGPFHNASKRLIEQCIVKIEKATSKIKV